MKKLLSLLAVGALLSACGGGNGNGSSATADGMPAASASNTDRFASEVARVVGSTSESSEPAAVDTATATAPEDTESDPVS